MLTLFQLVKFIFCRFFIYSLIDTFQILQKLFLIFVQNRYY